MYIHVCTWYVHGMYIPGCKRVCTSFRHVCTCLYYYVQFLNHINMYKLYIECCVAHVQCTDGYIHFMKCTDIAEPKMYKKTICMCIYMVYQELLLFFCTFLFVHELYMV